MLLAGAVVLTASFGLSAQIPAAPSAHADAVPVAAKKITLEDRFAFLPDVVATVGDTKITKKDIISEFGAKNIPELLASVPEKELRDYAKAIVDAKIDEIILLKLAEKDGIKPSPELVKQSLDADLAKLTPENRAAMEQQLKSQGKTVDGLKNEYINNPEYQRYFAVKTYLDKYFEGKTGDAMTDAQVQEFYNKHKNDAFRKNVKLSHILILANGENEKGEVLSPEAAKQQDADAKKKIEEIKAKLASGGKFETLAAENSACGSAREGGSLGNVTRGQMVPEFEQAAFAMDKPGQMSDIVRTNFGYHIIRYDGGEYYPLDDSVKAYIREDAVQRKKAELVESLLDSSRKAMNVTQGEFAAPAVPVAPAMPVAPAAK